ncbi:MAG TPA: VWA domain-containing protein [Pyrinomonadaceae bacterium]|nr:VWA domain-containing protein [Pyrinomonadaceae bacterium]
MLQRIREVLTSYFAVCIVVSLLSVQTGHAQDIDPNDVIRVNTDLVVFDAQVIDKKTRKVFGGLRREDFEIYEENVRQPIVYFSQDQLPLSVLLLLDISRSVTPIIEQVGAGANEALQRLKPEDEVAVMAFADNPKLIQSFTKDRKVAAEKISEAGTTDLGHGTYLNEALHAAEQAMNNASNPTNRRAIIVITDNIAPAGGHFGKDKVINDLLESGTVVYGLIVRAALGKVFNVLSFGTIHGVNEYCEETGGEVLGADQKEVNNRLAEMFTRLRTRYTLGYRPPESNEEGKFRRVKVQLTPPIMKTNKKLVVRARTGYYFRKRNRVS